MRSSSHAIEFRERFEAVRYMRAYTYGVLMRLSRSASMPVKEAAHGLSRKHIALLSASGSGGAVQPAAEPA